MKLFLHAPLKGSKLKVAPLLFALLLPGAGHTVESSSLNLKRSTEIKVSSKFINVTGTVRDDKGEPLPGVVVKIKGTNTATTTDANGVFRLNLPIGNETLVFSFLGFRTLEVAASGKTNLDIRLQENTESLEEVVVVGYGTQKKAHLTGSVVEVNVAELEDLPATNIGAALAGRVLGVGASGGTSRPGSKATLTVRKPNTFGKDVGNGEPLFVIDGIIQVNSQNQPDALQFNNLDPAEVESISILKDAAAAVYGVRGANGVVLVTTKRGKDGKPRISYNGSYSLNDEAYRTKMMSAYQFGQYYNIMNGPNGENILPTNTNYRNRIFTEDELEHFKTLDYNYLDEAWSSSYNTRHAVNVSGGAERATYFAGISYSKQNGNLGTLDYNKWNFRAGSDIQVASNFKVGLQVSGNEDQLDKTFNKIGSELDDNDYKSLLTAAPYVPLYINGLPVKLPGATSSSDFSNYHFFEIERLGNQSKTNSKFFTVNLSAEYQVPFIKGLKARATYGRSMQSSANTQVGTKYNLYEFTGLGTHGHIYEGATTSVLRQASNGNRLWFGNSNGLNTQANFFLNYDKQIGKHNISGLFSVERGEAKGTQEDLYRADPLDGTNGQLNTATGAIEGRTFAYESGSLGYIGRINYRYSEKYLVEFLFRSDASTKFAPENYWGKFYSASFGWVASEEDFFNVKGIDFLKIRYSTGLMGNDRFQPWAWRQRYTYQAGKGGVFGGNGNATTGMKMERSPNRNATWSDEFKNNIGIDARFLDNRLSTTLEGFYNKGYNILVERVGNVPVTVGGSVAAENYGKVNTFGYEIELGWNDKVGSDFRYGISTRLAWADDRIVDMDYNATNMLKPWNARHGASSDFGMWGYDYLGMFKTQQDIDAYIAEYGVTQMHTVTADKFRPGMLYYRDVRGPLQADGTFAAPDGIIDENDQIQLSRRKNNNYGYGITLKAGYKNFSVDAVIAGSFGGWSEFGNGSGERKKLNNDITRTFNNLPVIWGDIYDPVINPTGTMPNPNWESTYSVSSNFWKANSFRMRVTSFNLNYTLPKQLLEKMKVSNARIYFSGMNPWGIYQAYDYKDTYGTSWDAFPNLKTYSFGLNLTL
jgi:TonB-linked SusC/RagA family outer membrane protein